MARTVDDIVRTIIGGQALQIASLQAQVEKLTEELQQLRTAQKADA
jgi:hypothetical protein